MKVFIVAALIAVASAARLDHLERSYLPPTGGQGNFGANTGSNTFPTSHGTFGHGGQGSQYTAPGSNGFGSGSNGFGASGQGTNAFGASARGSNGFGANAYSPNSIGSDRGSNGFGIGSKSNGFGANGRNGGANAAITNQYLPPNYGSSGSNGGSNFGSSIRPACSTCGSSPFGAAPQRYTSQQRPQNFGSQGLNIPGTQYGTPQLGSTFGTQQDEPFGAASRQYLTPKASNFQDIPQQAFDEQTGYHY